MIPFFATDAIAVVVTLITLMGVVAPLALDRWKSRSADDLPLRGVIALFAASLAIVIVAWLSPEVHAGFGLLRVYYHATALTFPLAGLALLTVAARATGGGERIATALLGAGLVGVLPLAAYMTFVEPYHLVHERTTVELRSERAGSAPLTIAVLADIQTDHVGEYEARVIRETMAAKPDIILLPGDVLQTESQGRWDRELPAVRKLLGQLAAPGGVFLVEGDVDPDPAALVEGTGVRLLQNERAEIRIRDRRVTLLGVEVDYRARDVHRAISALETAPGEDDIRIVVAHRPDVAEVTRPTSDSRIDLFVTGHTHGGQVNIPLFGPPLTLSDVPRDVAAGGLHELGGRTIYVSRGIGMERGEAPRLRLNAPPEISFVTLE